MIYFTSDTHFGHNNNIKYSNRPFQSILEHDEILIENWNNIVKPGDDIYHLGDVGLCSKQYLISILERLNGNKFLILGNHDYKYKNLLQKYFIFIKDIHILEIKKNDIYPIVNIILCHYAMQVWPKSHFGSWSLYGHSHGGLQEDDNLMSFDVGVDCWEYKPISLLQVCEKMKQKIERKRK